MVTKDDILRATRQGLDIIVDCCPEARAAVESPKRFFRVRAGERTPSARLYAPSAPDGEWRVVDYGGSGEERSMGPIDLYMHSRGYTQSQFALALTELAERYGVEDDDRVTADNRPSIERRPAEAGEEAGTHIRLLPAVGDAALRVWPNGTTREALSALGWSAVESKTTVRDGQATVVTANDRYPIFAQQCRYTADDGSQRTFTKVYEPLSAAKEYRFFYIGRPPRDYLYGLDALVRAWEQNGRQRLPRVAVVSGGSDAVAALSRGCQPVYLGSETYELTRHHLDLLGQYADSVVLVPDVDATGLRVGRATALRFPDLRVAWLPREELARHRDRRGNPRKDLADYVALHPQRADFERLMARAQTAQFWTLREDRGGTTHVTTSLSDLCYFLTISGFGTWRDPHSGEKCFVQREHHVVQRVLLDDVRRYLSQWLSEHDVPTAVDDCVQRSNDVSKLLQGCLPEMALCFDHAGEGWQWLYFRNAAVRVTAEEVEAHAYDDEAVPDVWRDDIVQHDYRPLPPEFEAVHGDDGRWHLTALGRDGGSEVLRFLVGASHYHWQQEERGEALTDEQLLEEQQGLLNKLFAIGYLMHQYRAASRGWGVLLMDATMGDGEQCNGRSGKSLLGKVLAQMLPTATIEAKSRDVTSRPFLFAGVRSDTRLVFVDECHRNLDLNFFFGKLTDGLTVERKGIDAYVIPYGQSPKFVIATNYVPKEMDASTQARLLPVVFSDYFHEATADNGYTSSRSVRDLLGHDLMDEHYTGWDADVALLVSCLQFYLGVPAADGKLLPPLTRIAQRQALARMGRSFSEWAADYFQPGGGHLDAALRLDTVVGDYVRETGDHTMSARRMGRLLRDYCKAHTLVLNPHAVTGAAVDGDNWRKREGDKMTSYIYLSTGQSPLPEGTQTELPI